jgi:hypothetical protein
MGKTMKPANHYHVLNEQFMNSQRELPAALEVCLDLVKDLLHPEVFGHAMPDEVKSRAFVVRAMLERLKARMEASDA